MSLSFDLYERHRARCERRRFVRALGRSFMKLVVPTFIFFLTCYVFAYIAIGFFSYE